ncbi:hypothetical protein [Lancefieldella rimae]|uniref:hypothetical protein n=1 Tax=Lancefieldella rimae TaxID=1383 RepID=UPI001CAD404A|nr:hypothetical protein [Lancefieldella rimae]MBF4804199.1 hypothetical protein [Lancefieldella rimae]
MRATTILVTVLRDCYVSDGCAIAACRDCANGCVITATDARSLHGVIAATVARADFSAMPRRTRFCHAIQSCSV